MNDIFRSGMVLGCGSGIKANGKPVPSMEAVGIDVFTTLKRLGIELQRNPEDRIVFSCLICTNEGLRK